MGELSIFLSPNFSGILFRLSHSRSFPFIRGFFSSVVRGSPHGPIWQTDAVQNQSDTVTMAVSINAF
jgi:hypothetical protein